MNNIIDSLKTVGVWGLVAIIAYGIQTAQPLLKALIGSVKNRKLRNGLGIANSYATTAVTTLASFTNLSNSERKAKAVSMVADKLSKRGITISADEVSKIVESCYQYAKNHGNLIDKQPKQTTTGDQQANQQAQQVNDQLNPQPVSGQSQANSQSSQDDEAKRLAQQVNSNPRAQELLKGMNQNGQQSN